jgi:hypothetical protein
VAELKHVRDTVDPFALSGIIQAKLEHIFQLNAEAGPKPDTASTACTGFRGLP